MSNPNFENIDRWFFEYAEGNLSVEQESQLMSFLELHPELISELNIWKSAKAKAPVHPTFNTAPLIKKAPVLFRPVPLAIVSFLTLASLWLGYSALPVTALYVQSNIDAEVIDTEDEEALLFTQHNEINNKKSNAKEIQSKKNIESVDVNKSYSLATHSANKTSNNGKLAPTGQALASKNSSFRKQDVNPLENKAADSPTNDYMSTIAAIDIKKESSHKIELNSNIHVDDLAKITSYLTRESQETVVNNSNAADNIAQNNSRKSGYKNSSASKSSLKKSLNKTLRKIKRMADYPLALQNTKSPYFHAPMMTGYKANFGMVGSAIGNRVQATSRAQWLDNENAQLMNTLSWDGYIYALRGGLGVEVNYNNYQSNELNNYSAAITYSPKFSINKKISFEPAINFKMGVVNLEQNADIIGGTIELDRNNIVPLFENQNTANGSQLWYRDIGLGFMLNTKSFYLGFNADNLGQHNNNYHSSDIHQNYKSDIYYTAVIGTEYSARTKDFKLSGYGLYQKYGNLEEFWLGTNLRYEWLHIGMAANNHLDLAGTIGTDFKRFSINYNLDYTKSRLLNEQLLSHQLSVRVLLKPSRYAAKFLKL